MLQGTRINRKVENGGGEGPSSHMRIVFTGKEGTEKSPKEGVLQTPGSCRQAEMGRSEAVTCAPNSQAAVSGGLSPTRKGCVHTRAFSEPHLPGAKGKKPNEESGNQW